MKEVIPIFIMSAGSLSIKASEPLVQWFGERPKLDAMTFEFLDIWTY